MSLHTEVMSTNPCLILYLFELEIFGVDLCINRNRILHSKNAN